MLEEGKLYECTDPFELKFTAQKEVPGSQNGSLKGKDVVMFCGYKNGHEHGLLLRTDGVLFAFQFNSEVDTRQEHIFKLVGKK